MLSKNKIKYILSLHQKKYRDKQNQFFVEGDKLALELIKSSYSIKSLIATQEFESRYSFEIQSHATSIEEIIITDRLNLKKISALNTPQQAFIIAEKKSAIIPYLEFSNQLLIVLDGIQNPGNLGTIIRTADWFGIKHIICSPDCADLYNPKVIQATMGAFLRTQISYMPLQEFFNNNHLTGMPVFGTFMEGEKIYEIPEINNGILLFGNEGKGISDDLKGFITKRITIPAFGTDETASESLNVAVSVGIICSEFRRKQN